jgi:metal-sulfur cluster biosynthetic enzyme
MTRAQIREALRQVVDPELGINIVDLGLVYSIETTGHTVQVTMTMTSPACPLRDYLKGLVESALTSNVCGAQCVLVEIVSDPPWTADRMSDAARRLLQ